jgi:hypothetical protein
MNAPQEKLAPTLPADIMPGTPFDGGLFCKRLFNGGTPYALVVSTREGDLDPAAHRTQLERATAAALSGHSDWKLPNRAEALAMEEDLRAVVDGTENAFERDWYWTDKQHESDSDSAWVQSFDWGGQDYYHKSYKIRARLVRRVPI